VEKIPDIFRLQQAVYNGNATDRLRLLLSVSLNTKNNTAHTAITYVWFGDR